MKRATPASVLAANVRELRKVRKLSQARLAAAAGMDRADVSRLENGKANPALDRIGDLARALGVSPDSLLRSPSHA